MNLLCLNTITVKFEKILWTLIGEIVKSKFFSKMAKNGFFAFFLIYWLKTMFCSMMIFNSDQITLLIFVGRLEKQFRASLNGTFNFMFRIHMFFHLPSGIIFFATNMAKMRGFDWSRREWRSEIIIKVIIGFKMVIRSVNTFFLDFVS